MKGLSAKELMGHEPAELENTLRKLREDLFKYRLKQTTNQLENTMLIRKTRRDIARVNTVLSARLSPSNPGSSAPAGSASAAKAKEGP